MGTEGDEQRNVVSEFPERVRQSEAGEGVPSAAVDEEVESGNLADLR
jgi:hypothetical protein